MMVMIQMLLKLNPLLQINSIKPTAIKIKKIQLVEKIGEKLKTSKVNLILCTN